jgi:hypothetical protein
LLRTEESAMLLTDTYVRKAIGHDLSTINITKHDGRVHDVRQLQMVHDQTIREDNLDKSGTRGEHFKTLVTHIIHKVECYLDDNLGLPSVL